MMVQRLTTIATVTALISAVSTPAIAQRRRAPRGRPAAQTQPAEDPTTLEARRAYDSGRDLLTNNQAAEALGQFQRAYELRPNPVVLLPIAQAQTALGQIPDAITTLERYLAERADAPDRAQVEQQLTELRRRPATMHVVSTPAGARIVLDGRDTGLVTPADVPAEPGHHALRLELDGHTASDQEFDATPGGRAELTAELAAAPVATPVEIPADAATLRPDEGRRISPAIWAAAGTAGAGVVAGTVFGFLALGELSDYNANPSVEARDRGQTYALISDISFGVAILSAAVGAVVFFSDRGERRTPAPTTEPGATPAPQTQAGLRIGPGSLQITF